MSGPFPFFALFNSSCHHVIGTRTANFDDTSKDVLASETVGNLTGVKMFLRCAGTVEPSLEKDSDQ